MPWRLYCTLLVCVGVCLWPLAPLRRGAGAGQPPRVVVLSSSKAAPYEEALAGLQILRGTRASAMPPVPPRYVAYTLNQKTVRHMKLEIPEALMRGAREVF